MRRRAGGPWRNRGWTLASTLFAVSPWAVIRRAITDGVEDEDRRREALAFLGQAEDFYVTAVPSDKTALPERAQQWWPAQPRKLDRSTVLTHESQWASYIEEQLGFYRSAASRITPT